MSKKPEDKKPEELIPVPTGKGHSAGRVQVDSRGRNVWHWNDAQIDSTSILLKRLENDELELEPTRKVPVQKTSTAASEEAECADRRRPSGHADLSFSDTLSVKVGGGFDPYNRS